MTASTGELLKFICDYQSLVGRRTLLRASLSAADLARLAALEELLASAASAAREDGERDGETATPSATPTDPAAHRRFARMDVSLHATVEVGARAASVTIGNIGAGGALVKQPDAERPSDLQRGELTLVTVSDPTSRRAFLFPARVAWRDQRGCMGLTFVGIPKELHASASGTRISRPA